MLGVAVDWQRVGVVNQGVDLIDIELIAAAGDFGDINAVARTVGLCGVVVAVDCTQREGCDSGVVVVCHLDISVAEAGGQRDHCCDNDEQRE